MIILLIGCCVFAVTMATPLFPEEGSAEVTCISDGWVYRVGESMPVMSPCKKPCWCGMDGEMHCSRVRCPYTDCFDPITPDPTANECCYKCPNGANCKLDNALIAQSVSVTQKVGNRCSSVCTCMYGGQEPTCILQCDDVPPLDLVKSVFDTNNKWKSKPANQRSPWSYFG